MKNSLKCIIGILLVCSGISFLTGNFFSVSAGIFFMAGGLLLIPSYWVLAKIEFPKTLRGLNQTMVVFIPILSGFCLLNIGLLEVDITTGERPYAHIEIDQRQEINNKIETLKREPYSWNSIR